MFSLSKIKQLNLFERISELNHLSAKQPIGFLNLLSDNLDLESFVPNVITICDEFNNLLPNNSPYKDRNSMLIYDTSGLKPKVKENNPKTLVFEINKQKS